MAAWEAEKARTVCVTGAGGYLGSWLVKLLLSRHYTVHATLRNPEDEKYVHLKKLDKAAENLKLFKADLLDYNSISAAIRGCDGVFHVASPVPSGSVPNPEVELVEPAVKGTLNVLKACSEANVKRVVAVSSTAAVVVSPNRHKGEIIDETCWSDGEYCKTTNNWYCYSKTVAESEALQYAKETGLDVLTVCPSFVLGPMLQRDVNASSLVLIKLLKEGYEEIENKFRDMVDVRDVAEALLLVYGRPEAEGRYICSSHLTATKDMVEILRKNYPNYKYPKRFIEVKDQSRGNVSSEKLQRLGWRYRPVEETLVDSVESYQQAGILD
ncbi:cinnamoyl-CoA reductase 1-like [Coffea eugenioides]|uniref:cinnamoyl-CoA reductase 1-like n=1 Tax=Coffea eugenioides TaxID=49369 RepID=UPI000F610CF7|nr:cinnamoyl-CoA reductase 1-like [Coffea eugenioides]